MDKVIYLKNRKIIEKLQKENSDYLVSIYDEELEQCPFCFGDIIKDKGKSFTITGLRFFITDDGKTVYQASGFLHQAGLGLQIVDINSETQKIGEDCSVSIIFRDKQVNKYFKSNSEIRFK